MKKFTTLLFALLAVVTANAQIIKDEEIDTALDKLYPDANWTRAATSLSQDLQLDPSGDMVFEKVIPCEGTKSELYIAANQWFTQSFDNARQAITLNDKESGTIMAQPLVPDVAEHSGFLNFYAVNLQPIIRVDIKDGKVRMKYTLQNYDVGIIYGGGTFGDFSSLDDFDEIEKWPIKGSYPYVDDGHNKTSSKAFLVAYVYAQLIMEKFETAMKNAATAANDNW